MQRPTCSNIRIRSARDAHKIFVAIQQGKLQMVNRRLDADERLALRPGCVYAWEERGPNAEVTGLGIERFTEGRHWSPSRVRDEFLFYHEKYVAPDSTSDAAGNQPPRGWDRLVKQTYSVWVQTQNGKRKWHLTSYYTEGTVDNLGTVDDIDSLQNITIPDGMFTKSTRSTKNRKARQGRTKDTEPAPVSRTYAPYPSEAASSHPPPPASPPQSQSVQMYHPYPRSNQQFPEYDPQPVPSSSGRPAVPNSGLSYSQTQPSYPVSSMPGPSRPPPPPIASGPRPAVNYALPPSHPSPSSSHSSRSSQESPYLERGPSHWYTGPPQQPYVENQPLVYSYPEQSPASFNTTSTGFPPQHAHLYAMVKSHHLPLTGSTVQNLVAPIPLSSSSSLLIHDQYDPGADSDGTPSSSSMSSVDESRRGDIGPSRALAPLHTLKRRHPYRRDPADDKALRLLDPSLATGTSPETQ
ncbi:uncharacterized protein BT62DRAFT_931983 [Guyanagaster necrorhizus]|uniref:cAMP-independent regulatory protein pac2 n=1 Tax=Guyanagaster necrorhizus TaxID=856835 RepID=A0A9P7VSC7_9AGAR|nr:uncharacterized protein BT62DRAFT_931983 [Guyanagaster necrorhizus MCA 3950]KAG7446548.1 hypothetical protein BT62DRAFT_931983 [Guyanagaster necrorhizus MCA 3950]